MWRCAQTGQVFHLLLRERSSELRTGRPTSAVRMIASAFHRVKYNIE
jgi:hypothetical protein